MLPKRLCDATGSHRYYTFNDVSVKATYDISKCKRTMKLRLLENDVFTWKLESFEYLESMWCRCSEARLQHSFFAVASECAPVSEVRWLRCCQLQSRGEHAQMILKPRYYCSRSTQVMQQNNAYYWLAGQDPEYTLRTKSAGNASRPPHCFGTKLLACTLWKLNMGGSF